MRNIISDGHASADHVRLEMAQTYINQSDSAQESTASLMRMANVIGLAVSLALIGVGVVWGYNLLLVRDVKGIPVVRAKNAPMVVQPEDPGGYQARNQGLSINQVVETGLAANPPAKVKLAPPQADLGKYVAKDDLSRRTDLVNDSILPEEAAFGRKRDAVLAQMNASGSARAIDQALKEITGQVIVVPRPKARPEINAGSGGESEDSAGNVSNAKIREVAAEDVPKDTQMAQLGAFGTRDLALSHWNWLQNEFGDYIKGRDLVIQKRQSGGRVFYRLRTLGFENIEHTRRFCAALVTANADCIPVLSR